MSEVRINARLYADHDGEQMMPINDQERAQWSRFAQASFANEYNAVGVRFSVAATRRELPLAEFHSLQHQYREWLVSGTWPSLPAERK